MYLEGNGASKIKGICNFLTHPILSLSFGYLEGNGFSNIKGAYNFPTHPTLLWYI